MNIDIGRRLEFAHGVSPADKHFCLSTIEVIIGRWERQIKGKTAVYLMQTWLASSRN